MGTTAPSQRAYTALRRARTVVYWAAEIIDRPANLINGRRPYPPLYLRRDIGPLHNFESSAYAMVAHLQRSCGLTPESRLMDMGCGCGSLVFALRNYFTTGTYYGIDVDPRMIRWSGKHLANKHFAFAHYPYWNGLYNPSGKRMAPFPAADASVDVVLMKSVFTHMLRDDVAHYIRELGRVLSPGAQGIITAYVYSASEPRDDEFPYAKEGYKHAKPLSPESNLALPHDWLLDQFQQASITADVQRKPGQDHVLIRRA